VRCISNLPLFSFESRSTLAVMLGFIITVIVYRNTLHGIHGMAGKSIVLFYCIFSYP